MTQGHRSHMEPAAGTQGLNVNSIAIQVPIKDLTRHHDGPTDVMAMSSVIGVWATASRRRVRSYSSETSLVFPGAN